MTDALGSRSGLAHPVITLEQQSGLLTRSVWAHVIWHSPSRCLDDRTHANSSTNKSPKPPNISDPLDWRRKAAMYWSADRVERSASSVFPPFEAGGFGRLLPSRLSGAVSCACACRILDPARNSALSSENAGKATVQSYPSRSGRDKTDSSSTRQRQLDDNSRDSTRG